MLKLKSIVLTMVLMCMASVEVGASRPLTYEESDSVSHALAAMWGDYLYKARQKQGQAAGDEYMRGLQDALKFAADTSDAYFHGLEQGVVIAKRIAQIEELGGFDVNIDQLSYLLKQASKGRKNKFTPASAEKYMGNLMSELSAERELVAKSAEYIKEAATHPGAVTTKSGLVFEVLVEGEGAMPADSDYVMVNYKGYLPDGTVFSATDKNDTGSAFFVNETIPGFSEGLKMMKKGGSYRLYVPPQLGYGSKGYRGLVPGNVVIVYDVKLLDILSDAKKNE